MVKFPDSFFFGSATSATQSEGAHAKDIKGKDIWDEWYEQEPFAFHGGIGPQHTSTFYKNYKTDIQLLKETGHNSFRTSISWSRLFPKGYGEINQEAVQFYMNVFKELKAQGIEPFVSLYHFDMPAHLQILKGWENREVVSYYCAYAKTCFELFGDLVKHWFTFNEPIVHVECGYLNGHHYPCRVDPKAAIQVAYHTALASALAIRAYHDQNQDGKIGIILNLTPAYPRSDNPLDIEAAKMAELFANNSFLDPSLKGEYDPEFIKILKMHKLLPTYSLDDVSILKEHTVDFLGVNYYQPLRVCAKRCIPNPNAPFTPEYYYDHYKKPGRRMNPYRGWEIYPKGVYDIAMNIKEHYGNIEWMITENGMGVEDEERFMVDGKIEDDYRIDFYKEHLTWLSKGIAQGSNCIGYHVWTGIDCWSWLNAYKNRYGLISLNVTTQERTIKKSGYWFKELARQKGFED